MQKITCLNSFHKIFLLITNKYNVNYHAFITLNGNTATTFHLYVCVWGTYTFLLDHIAKHVKYLIVPIKTLKKWNGVGNVFFTE
jgi:hypothetical protein